MSVAIIGFIVNEKYRPALEWCTDTRKAEAMDLRGSGARSAGPGLRWLRLYGNTGCGSRLMADVRHCRIPNLHCSEEQCKESRGSALKGNHRLEPSRVRQGKSLHPRRLGFGLSGLERRLGHDRAIALKFRGTKARRPGGFLRQMALALGSWAIWIR